MKQNILLLALCWPLLAVQAQPRYEATWQSLDTRPIPAWFEDAKFGIFIHWGLYSVPAWAPNTGEPYADYAEWYWYRLTLDEKDGAPFRQHHRDTYGDKFQYQDFVPGFTAEMFDPAQWADIIKASGARYVVLTSKHHEGFALWPSAQSVNWNSVDVGPHRDICGELTQAVKARGLHMGFYYSLYEWHHPLYRTDVNRYVDQHMLPQLRDLTLRYEPDIIWGDGEWEQPSSTWRSEEFLAWLYNESPVRETVVVNDRWGEETRSRHGSFYTTEYDLIHDSDSRGVAFAHPWEECRGIANSFGYNRNENLEDYSTAAELVRILIEKVARGGNLLLNIGPTADGRIPVIMQERLAEMGEWLRVNGEAIYGTRQWASCPEANRAEGIFYTVKGHDLYVLVTEWTGKPIRVRGIGRPQGVHLLGTDRGVKHSYQAGTLTITPPSLGMGEAPCRHAWTFKVEGAFNQ